ncbi:MAG: PEP-CTERM sorting domain-containing protein [Candidatus Omnitrophica bacterium]|nr:PEP-CTERM sorting domain-containing protein [Candidatus Omnitrophota bacterium]
MITACNGGGGGGTALLGGTSLLSSGGSDVEHEIEIIGNIDPCCTPAGCEPNCVPAVTPEPASMVLIGGGMLAMAYINRKRKA